MTRDIAQRFNRLYGDTFVIPKPTIAQTGSRIRALNNPAVKMSKSQAHIPGHAVRLLDEPDTVRRLFRAAVTDAGREIRFSAADEKAGVTNLLEIFHLFSGMEKQEAENHFEGKGYSDLKAEVAEVVIEALVPIRAEYGNFISDPAELLRILGRGADKARALAQTKLEEVKDRVGLLG